jgi:8-oxo-dGTP pyrophosphatase MutT (NUDIX family)
MTMTPIKPAATVVLVRDTHAGIETLLLRRNKQVKFAGGAWVFPGGKVEPDEHEQFDEQDAAKHAAVRECYEEAGLAVEVEALLPFAHWTTPENMSKRFATWFFIARVGDNLNVQIDGSEIHDHQWCLASNAIEQHQQGDLTMMPPTVVTLTELAGANNCAELFEVYAERNVRPFIPRITYVDEVVCMLYQGDAGYDACDPRAEGPRNRLWMEEAGSRYENTID